MKIVNYIVLLLFIICCNNLNSKNVLNKEKKKLNSLSKKVDFIKKERFLDYNLKNKYKKINEIRFSLYPKKSFSRILLLLIFLSLNFEITNSLCPGTPLA